MNRAELTVRTRTVAVQLLHEKGYISPVEVLIAMKRLTKADYERWRMRQVPFLEKILPGNLSQHEFFLREPRAVAGESNLKPSRTAYFSWGKGSKQPLRFTRTGNHRLEESHATHYINPAFFRKKDTPAKADGPAE